MYQSYFGLAEAPFSITLDPLCLYMSQRHREALLHLLYGVNVGGGFVLLAGKLSNWRGLNFADFRVGVKQLFRQDIPLAWRNDQEDYFNRQRERMRSLDVKIAQHETVLNRTIYTLFQFMPDKIALIDAGED